MLNGFGLDFDWVRLGICLVFEWCLMRFCLDFDRRLNGICFDIDWICGWLWLRFYVDMDGIWIRLMNGFVFDLD